MINLIAKRTIKTYAKLNIPELFATYKDKDLAAKKTKIIDTATGNVKTDNKNDQHQRRI